MRTRVSFLFRIMAVSGLLLSLAPDVRAAPARSFQLDQASFQPYIDRFNSMEEEDVTNYISNAASWDWLCANIPFFECPDREVEEIYYFRWWSFRKHIKQTPNGFVITEFLTPVGHAGSYNTISCATGHHLAEGRWLQDPRYLKDYIRFWLRPQPHFHRYSSWYAWAVWDRYRVAGDRPFTVDLLDDLVADYLLWESERQLPNGLFWQFDVRDGMEESISGSRTAKQPRPSINSYMFANARAIAALARLANRPDLASVFQDKAAELKRLVQAELWDDRAGFFKVRREDGQLAGVREAIGYLPWAFGLPDATKNRAWAQFVDADGFRAPFGITTAERRHPAFRSHGTGTCEWDGAVWPFATSQTLQALANVLGTERSPDPNLPVSRQDYFDAFLTYVRSHRFEDRPYIGEYLDEVTGQWLKGNSPRSRYYNHSTFADLLITGVVGLRPRADETVEVHPLIPPGTWDWFCLDGVTYHGRRLTILWDKNGDRYHRGKGLVVFADGRQIARTNERVRLTGSLP